MYAHKFITFTGARVSRSVLNFCHLLFGFVSIFGFRASNFGTIN